MELKADRSADAGDDHFGGSKWGQRDEEHAMRESIYLAVSHLQGKTGFANPCQSNQDDQTVCRILTSASRPTKRVVGSGRLALDPEAACQGKGPFSSTESS